MPNYYLWIFHRELVPPTADLVASAVNVVMTNPIEGMVEDAAQSMFHTVEVNGEDANVEEEPNVGANYFIIYWMPLKDRCGIVVKVELN